MRVHSLQPAIAKNLWKFCAFGFLQMVLIQSVAADPLEGGVEVQARIEPLSSKLSPGLSLDETAVLTDSDWYAIPEWLSGTWQTVQILQLSSVDQRTAHEDTTCKAVAGSEEETFGYQLDNQRRPWTLALSVGFKESGTSGNFQWQRRVNLPIGESSDSVTFRSNDLLVDLGESAHIKGVVRRQIKRNLHRMDANTVSALYWSREYDAAGLPSRTGKEIRIMRKIGDFSPKDMVGDRDLKTSFIKFLQKTGHANLISSGKEQ
jgi:hypothetical protein